MKRILIIGLGLMGGSLARAITKHNLAEQIYAFDSNLDNINLAKNQNIIDGFAMIDETIADFDLIVIASPLSSYKDIFLQLAKYDLQDTIIMDLGSLKDFIKPILPKKIAANFVPCHPIAGSEKTGFDNSNEDLFFNKKFIICGNKTVAAQLVEKMITKIGANIEFIDSKQHDKIYALISHLPQFLSFLTKDFSPKMTENDLLKTSFRLDDSSSEIWGDIFKINEKNLEKYYNEFYNNIQYFKKDIETNNFNKIITQSLDIQQSNMYGVVTISNKNLDEKILFRYIIVLGYLKIKDIAMLKSYAGSGFRDFTSIISLLELNEENLILHKKQLLTMIDKAFN